MSDAAAHLWALSLLALALCGALVKLGRLSYKPAIVIEKRVKRTE